MVLEVARDDTGAIILTERCKQLLETVRKVLGKSEVVDPTDYEAYDALLTIAIFVAMENGELTYGHPKVSEAKQWRSKYLEDFDSHRSDMWDPNAEYVKERRSEEEALLDEFVKICEQYSYD